MSAGLLFNVHCARGRGRLEVCSILPGAVSLGVIFPKLLGFVVADCRWNPLEMIAFRKENEDVFERRAKFSFMPPHRRLFSFVIMMTVVLIQCLFLL